MHKQKNAQAHSRGFVEDPGDVTDRISTGGDGGVDGTHQQTDSQEQKLTGQLHEIGENVSYLLEENQALQTLLARIIDHLSQRAPDGPVNADQTFEARERSGDTAVDKPISRNDVQKADTECGRLLAGGIILPKTAPVRTWDPPEFHDSLHD